MQVTAQKSDLIRALALCGSVVESKATIPILQNVHLSNNGGGLNIMATDMDMELSVTIPAKFSRAEQDPITLPAKLLGDVAKKGASDILSITVKDDKATLTTGAAKFNLGTLPAGDFPVFAHAEGGDEFTIAGADMAALITAVKYAMSGEQARFYLCGVHLHAQDAGGTLNLRAVTTDGHRLAYMDAPSIDATLGALEGCILPAKACVALLKILAVYPEPAIEAVFTAHAAHFTLPDLTFNTKLIDGKFPDYSRVIPRGNDRTARLYKAVLAEAIGRVICLADSRSRAVKLSFSDDGLVVSTKSDRGNAEEKVEFQSWTGQKLDIGFNGSYLLDTLSAVGEEVELVMSDPASPAIVHSYTGGDRDVARFDLLMPLRVL